MKLKTITIHKSAYCVVLFWLFTFGLGAFFATDFNIKNWSPHLRFVFVTILFIITPIMIFLGLVWAKNIKL